MRKLFAVRSKRLGMLLSALLVAGFITVGVSSAAQATWGPYTWISTTQAVYCNGVYTGNVILGAAWQKDTATHLKRWNNGAAGGHLGGVTIDNDSSTYMVADPDNPDGYSGLNAFMSDANGLNAYSHIWAGTIVGGSKQPFQLDGARATHVLFSNRTAAQNGGIQPLDWGTPDPNSVPARAWDAVMALDLGIHPISERGVPCSESRMDLILQMPNPTS